MMLTWRKEWRINVNAEVSKEGRESMSKLKFARPRREMLDRDEDAEAMSQVIEKVYEDTYFRSENCVYHRHI